MHLPSQEQQDIIDAVGAAGTNIIIDAVAGSGKTTTVLHLARSYPTRQILLLTYNRRLRDESVERATKLGLTNLSIYTFHSYVARNGYANGTDGWLATTRRFTGQDDASLREFIDAGGVMTQRGHDLVIIDEAQDLTPLLWLVTLRVIEAEHPQLVVMGDANQAIYQYAGADSRFIMMADRVYASSLRSDIAAQWRRLPLATSYRITAPMAALVNYALGIGRGGDDAAVAAATNLTRSRQREMVSGRIGNTAAKPIYINDVTEDIIVAEIIELLHRGTSPSDIFVLAPSVRPGHINFPTKIANMLSDRDVPVYMPNNDHRVGDQRALAHKVVFSSFHQAKGLERPIVFVIDCDDGYYDWFGKSWPRDMLPNTLYVALTRATRQLYICTRSTPAAGMTSERLMELCTVRGELRDTRQPTSGPKPHAITEMLNHISNEQLAIIMNKFIDQQVIIPPGNVLGVESISRMVHNTGVFYEEVADISGVAVAAAFEANCMLGVWYGNGLHYDKAINDPAGMTIYDEYITYHPTDAERFLLTPAQLRKDEGVSRLLELSLRYIVHRDKTKWRLKQINQFEWMDACHLSVTTDRLLAAADNIDTHLEALVEAKLGAQDIIGYVDLIAAPADPLIYMLQREPLDRPLDMPLSRGRRELWEIKCVSNLSVEHVIQAALYAEIYWTAPDAALALLPPRDRMIPPTDVARDEARAKLGLPRVLLFNAKTGELRVVTVRAPGLLREVSCLKFCSAEEPLSDDSFLDMLAAYRRGDAPQHTACAKCSSAPLSAKVSPQNQSRCRRVVVQALRMFEGGTMYGRATDTLLHCETHNAYQVIVGGQILIVVINYDTDICDPDKMYARLRPLLEHDGGAAEKKVVCIYNWNVINRYGVYQVHGQLTELLAATDEAQKYRWVMG